MGLEYELKYAAEPALLAAVAEKLGGQWQEYAMRTTYYDTPGRLLAARRWTLRRRLENGVSVCTLKTPAALGRQEYETVCEDIRQAIPALCRLGAPAELAALPADDLVALCGAAFTRQAQRLTLPGCTVEVALDQGLLFAGEEQQPLCELEVELKEGSAEAAAAFAKELSDRFSLRSEGRSKFKRALALVR